MRNTLLGTWLLTAALLIGLPAAAQAPSLAELSAATQRVAEPYFAAYIARDWDKLAPLLGDDGGFSDPTAEPVFGKVESRGKAQVLRNFRENYAAIGSMQFHATRTLVSGRHAVFEGRLDWTLGLAGGREAVTEGMPFLTILKVEDGKVVDHQDFADDAPFLGALRKARGGG